MNGVDDTPLPAARDGFERYYAEKIWEWIPEIYRHEDGLAENPGVLRALVEVLAAQAANARRSIDRLWEDQYIDFADDWAVAYIGDLVGTRLVHELNRRGRRVDVAKTLFYRRRKGTPQVLEALIRDIAGWDGVLVESFRRLGRTRHGLDPVPGGLLGPVTGTPPGGTADLRRARAGEVVDGPFDDFAHTADCRRLRGFKGRYNIPRLNFHLYRLRPFRVALATPHPLGAQRYTFDPSGRNCPLFRPAQRPGGERCRPALEWEIPAAIPCRLLNTAAYRLAADAVPGALQTELAPLVGQHFGNEARLRQTLSTWLDQATLDANIAAILAAAITADSPKLKLLPAALAVLVGEHTGEPVIAREAIAAGNLEDWGASLTPPAEKRLIVDPERGRFLLLQAPAGPEQVFVPLHHYGFSGPIGAGTYDRRASVLIDAVSDLPGGARDADGHELEPGPIGGFALPADGSHQFVNSKTCQPDPPPADTVANVNELWLQAADRERPYLRLAPALAGEWIFSALAKPPDAGPEEQRLLTLEGLWVGVIPPDLAPQALGDAGASCSPVPATLVLDGVFDRVTIRHCTLDPGGEQARTDPLQCTAVPSVTLEIRGQVAELVIESSIVGAIHESTSAADPCSVGRLVVRDSIIHALAGPEAIATRTAELHLERVTVFGDINVNRLYASEALIQGRVRVIDDQHGCFRFSATNADPDRRLPPQFESHLIGGGIPNRWFGSRRFTDPAYAQLTGAVPDPIRRGAETRSEIGAFSSLLNPIKLDDLKGKVNEFMPFGLIAQYLNET